MISPVGLQEFYRLHSIMPGIGGFSTNANVYLWHLIDGGVIRASHAGLRLTRHIDDWRVRLMFLVCPD